MSSHGERNLMSEKEKWYTLDEATAVAGCSRATLNKACKEGRLVSSQITDSSKWGFHYMVSENALLDWVNDRKSFKMDVSAMDFSVEMIAQILERKIKTAYDEGYKDGFKSAKKQMNEAMKGIR